MPRMKIKFIALGLMVALLAIAPAAHATYNPLASGTTKLTLAKPFLALLKANKVKLTGQRRRHPEGGDRQLPGLRRQVRPDHLQRLHRTRRRPLLQSRTPRRSRSPRCS